MHVLIYDPQHCSSGYRVQGKEALAAYDLLRTAQSLQSAGAFLLVLEALPHALATHITSSITMPTIGIGAGPGTSGQVLVHDDMLAIWGGHRAKFVRVFEDVGKLAMEGVQKYVGAVKDGSFPNVESESYEMDPREWKAYLKLCGEATVDAQAQSGDVVR